MEILLRFGNPLRKAKKDRAWIGREPPLVLMAQALSRRTSVASKAHEQFTTKKDSSLTKKSKEGLVMGLVF